MNISQLEKMLISKQRDVEEFFHNLPYKNLPIFSSVDLRNSGFKIAHVDCNLFPAGFNNLTDVAVERACKNTQEYLELYFPKAKKILIAPENLTRNQFYQQNILTIKNIFEKANYEVDVATFQDDKLQIKVEGNVVSHFEFVPDLIILNNDLTHSVPKELINAIQPVVPNPRLGWHSRRKHIHFDEYQILLDKFAEKLQFDPWVLSCYYHNCKEISFKKREGIECIANAVDKLLYKIQKKYDEYKIDKKPYVFVKSNLGTFGMGVMTASSAQDILDINKKNRHSMDKIKYGVENTEIIIQEGVYSSRYYNGIAEHISYLVGSNPIGYINRYNPEKTDSDNLNSKGMQFQGIDEVNFFLENIVCRLSAYAVANE